MTGRGSVEEEPAAAAAGERALAQPRSVGVRRRLTSAPARWSPIRNAGSVPASSSACPSPGTSTERATADAQRWLIAGHDFPGRRAIDQHADGVNVGQRGLRRPRPRARGKVG
jgi:hypothetical protein